MKRLMTLCIALATLALISAPLFAEVQNVKVSGDVDTAGVYRSSYDLMSDSQTANGNVEDNNFIFTQARVKVDADLTDNVSATVRVLGEYDWGTEESDSEDQNVILDLANVTLKELLYAPLTVTIGKQELRYGTGFIIGDPDTNTTSADTNLSAGDLSLNKSFDAVKAVLDYDPLTVDLIYAKISESATRLTSPTATTGDDEDLYGVNLAYDVGQYDAEVEGYWFYNRDNDETATTGQFIHTFGVRGSLSPIDSLSLIGEVAWQKGDFDHHATTKRDQDAIAFQIAGDYTFPEEIYGITVPCEPMLKLGWTHYSGEQTANNGDHEAWIPLYEDQTHGVVANYILGGVNGGQNSNADILNVGASIVPLEDLSLSVDFYKFWLDEKLVSGNNDYASTGSALDWTNLDESKYYMKTDDDLGAEIDLALNYDYTEDVKMGLSAGWFKPGDAFDGAENSKTNDELAVQVLATLDVAF